MAMMPSFEVNTMSINKRSFTKAQAPSSVSAPDLIKRLNAALEVAPEKGQYTAIKAMVGNREVAVLKRHFEVSEYISAHQMRWQLINAYNE